MAETIESKLQNKIKVKLLIRGELGSDESHFYALRRGRIQIAGYRGGPECRGGFPGNLSRCHAMRGLWCQGGQHRAFTGPGGTQAH